MSRVAAGRLGAVERLKISLSAAQLGQPWPVEFNAAQRARSRRCCSNLGGPAFNERRSKRGVLGPRDGTVQDRQILDRFADVESFSRQAGSDVQRRAERPGAWRAQ